MPARCVALHVLCSVLCCCFVFFLLLLALLPMSSVFRCAHLGPIGHQFLATPVPDPHQPVPFISLWFCVFWGRELCVELWQSCGRFGIGFSLWFMSVYAFGLEAGLCRVFSFSCSCLLALLRTPGQTGIGKTPPGLHFTPT